jgi:hypothetical protein
MKLKDKESYERYFNLFQDFIIYIFNQIANFLPVKKEKILKISQYLKDCLNDTIFIQIKNLPFLI